MYTPIEDDEPAYFHESFSAHIASEWIVVMREEIHSIGKNQVWEIIDLLSRHKSLERNSFLILSASHMGQLISVKPVLW